MSSTTFTEKSVEKKDGARVHEKSVTASDAEAIDYTGGDDALQIVGERRQAEFSEEYYANLRRKLVKSRSSTIGISF
jgi:hypothetical protein